MSSRLGFARAGWDMTRTTIENKRHWADSDPMSGRAQTVKPTRKIARERSRLESQNNSWYAGMLRTAVNHIVGCGPRLQVQTKDAAFNSRIEAAWRDWSNAVGLVDKLRLCVETYWRDGEVFGMRAIRPSLLPISLDIRIYEGDQVAQPYWHVLDPTIEDGKRVDNLGNPVEYWIYDNHPGDLNIGHVNILRGNWYEADRVFHLYRQERPGQLRGMPRCAPAIDYLAHMRRFSKATLAAAEKCALWGVFVSTNSAAVTPAAMPSDFMTLEWERDSLNFLPDGWTPNMLDPKHPATTDEMFQRMGLMYFARCAGMPYSLASGTSKDSNFASAKMDIKNTWEPEVLGEQERVARIILAPIFRWFLEDCVFVEGLLDGGPTIAEIDYQFVWPPLPQSDEKVVAEACSERMSKGQSTLLEEWSRAGKDFDLAMAKEAALRGITVKQAIVEAFARAYASQKANSSPFNGSNGPENSQNSSETQPENQSHDALEETSANV